MIHRCFPPKSKGIPAVFLKDKTFNPLVIAIFSTLSSGLNVALKPADNGIRVFEGDHIRPRRNGRQLEQLVNQHSLMLSASRRWELRYLNSFSSLVRLRQSIDWSTSGVLPVAESALSSAGRELR